MFLLLNLNMQLLAGKFCLRYYPIPYNGNRILINPFRATGIFRNPLKKAENLWLSGVFRGYGKRPVA